jgi:hypothetical protein
MFHGLNNQFLYSAYKVEATFVDDIGNQKNGTGTCFFVLNRIGNLCLITNRHVFDIKYKKPGKFDKYTLCKITVSGKKGGGGENFPVADLVSTLDTRVIFADNYNNDIACIFDFKVLTGGDITIDYSIPYSFLATADDFQKKLTICDFVAFPGFPTWHDKRQNRPILRTGTISSDPRFDYSHSGVDDGACVAYEAFSFGGSSGSPIFAVQKGPKPGAGIEFPGFRELLCIGINAGHLRTDDKSHSGISYFYKSTAILEIIDR